MLASANDAANVIAEYVGGSMDNFVKMMNDKQKELGLRQHPLCQSHGLHNKKHYTCAHDMALIAQAALSDSAVPENNKKQSNTKSRKTKYMKEDRWLVNHQKMLYEDGELYLQRLRGRQDGIYGRSVEHARYLCKERRQDAGVC